MKKLLLVLALVVAYSFTATNATAKIAKVEKSNVVVAASDSDDSPATTVEKVKKDKKAKTTSKATVSEEKGCAAGCASCPEAEKKACAESKKTGEAKPCCEGAKKVEDKK